MSLSFALYLLLVRIHSVFFLPWLPFVRPLWGHSIFRALTVSNHLISSPGVWIPPLQPSIKYYEESNLMFLCLLNHRRTRVNIPNAPPSSLGDLVNPGSSSWGSWWGRSVLTLGITLTCVFSGIWCIVAVMSASRAARQWPPRHLHTQEASRWPLWAPCGRGRRVISSEPVTSGGVPAEDI